MSWVSEFLSMFQYGFMINALIAGVIIAIICPLIGNFLVLKKYSMIGDTLSHSAFAGVAIGLLISTNPLTPVIFAVVFTIMCSIFLEKLRHYYKQLAEMTMAIVLTLSVGIAITIISKANLNANISNYLFGSIITVSSNDLYVIAGLGIITIIMTFLLYNKLLFITFDEVGAKLSGIKVERVNYIFAALTAVTIAISIRITGMLVISSLIVLPVAAAMQISKSFKSTIFISVIVALIDVTVGLILSYFGDCAPGGAIALMSVFMMIVFIIINKVFSIKN